MSETNNIPEPPHREDQAPQLGRRFKFRHVNEITGTFVLILVAVLITAVLWMGHSQRWFKSRATLRIVLPEAGAAGIRQGSEVYFLGTLVGSVSDVIVDTTGRMEAVARIRSDFFRFVRVDSSAAVKKTFGVAGDSFFEITRGEGRPLPEKNASIVCKDLVQNPLEAAVEEIRGQAMVVLKKATNGLDTWIQLGADLGETRQHLDQLTIRLDKLVAGIEAGKGTVGKIVTDTALADEAQNLLSQANEVMADLQIVATNLNGAMKNIQAGTARLPEITDAVVEDARMLPALVEQTQTSMREIERLVEAMQRHWLLRHLVNKTNPPPSYPLPEITAPAKEPVRVLRSPRDASN